MWSAIGLTFGFVSLIWAVVYYAKKSANSTAQLEALKSEIKRIAQERERANKIIDSVRCMPDDDVRKRLQDRTGK